MSEVLPESGPNPSPTGDPAPTQVTPALLRFNPQALARLSQGTSVLIATLLAIPDGIALIPSAPTPLSWALRVLRVWLVALILWFIGFLAILHAVRIFARGIELNEKGVKLWRWGKLIAWSQIAAVGVEQQQVFSRAFCLPTVARRLTLYVRKGEPSKLSPQYVPSFFYQPGEFDALFNTICKARFDFIPDSTIALVCPASELDHLKSTAGLLRWQRVALSIVIALGLVMFLGRKASVNYLYSTGNQHMKRGEYALARRNYEEATGVDPAFPAAWHNLANAEFKLGDLSSAQKHWQRAVFLKPDFIEPKIGLAYLNMQQRHFKEARDLLDRALKIDPKNAGVLVNLADLEMRLGHTREAMKVAHLVLTQDPENHLAKCLLAQGRLRMGKSKEALQIVTDPELPGTPRFKESFCRLITGEIFLAEGRLAAAATLFESVHKQFPNHTDAMIDLAKARIRQGRLQEADDLLYKAADISPADPWSYIVRAELQRQLKDPAFAEKLLGKALAQKNQDARSLAAAAALSLELGHRRQAIELAQKSLAIEQVTPEALVVLEKAHKVEPP